MTFLFTITDYAIIVIVHDVLFLHHHCREEDLYKGLNFIRIVNFKCYFLPQDPPVSIPHTNEQGDLVGLDGFFGGILGLLQEGLNCT